MIGSARRRKAPAAEFDTVAVAFRFLKLGVVADVNDDDVITAMNGLHKIIEEINSRADASTAFVKAFDGMAIAAGQIIVELAQLAGLDPIQYMDDLVLADMMRK